MIATVVIGGSLLLAGIYSVAWLLTPRLRREIERPKHWFDAQTRQYDRACHEQRTREELGDDGAD